MSPNPNLVSDRATELPFIGLASQKPPDQIDYAPGTVAICGRAVQRNIVVCHDRWFDASVTPAPSIQAAKIRLYPAKYNKRTS
ncbi:hypothetical protein IVA95_11900 [Bradyrhizobium sp. 157]|uniref:hypothetical protein n=1 Tax=Bradyrhizobium sp. 157 TaxID=2782631 RepID=UPI001FF9EC64|nr:hypothetical protein [Bradyrhizobium sp. 157]MCK1638282.1 hypothetical protein [Bradyrhizobium sp. 157]